MCGNVIFCFVHQLDEKRPNFYSTLYGKYSIAFHPLNSVRFPHCGNHDRNSGLRIIKDTKTRLSTHGETEFLVIDCNAKSDN